MKIKNGFFITSIEGKSVVLVDNNSDVSFNGIVILNQVGLDIWNILTEGCSFDELIDCLNQKYNVPSDILVKDVNSFLEKIEFAIEK